MGVSKEDFKALDHKVTTIEGRIGMIRDGLGQMSVGVAQNLAAVKANLDSNSDALEQFDIFNQIWAKMILKLSERVAQTDYVVETRIAPQDLNEGDRALIKERAREWFTAVFNEMREEVRVEREAYLKELRAKAAEIQAEQEKAVKEEERAKKEAEIAESTLRGAEQNLSTPGGQGSEIPAGAEVFGG